MEAPFVLDVHNTIAVRLKELWFSTASFSGPNVALVGLGLLAKLYFKNKLGTTGK
jgi:hypothetical protein